MNTNETSREQLEQQASKLLKRHLQYTKDIAEMFELRREIERELEQIDIALKFYKPIASPVSRLDTQGRGAE